MFSCGSISLTDIFPYLISPHITVTVSYWLLLFYNETKAFGSELFKASIQIKMKIDLHN